MVGYSKLIETDEEAGAAIRAHCSELVDPRITEHRGRIVSAMGGSILAEFDSAIEAVQCGAEIQRAMPARNKAEPEDRSILFRIDIDSAENVTDCDDISERGINIDGPPEVAGIFISRETLSHETTRALGIETVTPETPWRWLGTFAVIMVIAIGGTAILVRRLTGT